MRSICLVSLVSLVACSGSGVSTTARASDDAAASATDPSAGNDTGSADDAPADTGNVTSGNADTAPADSTGAVTSVDTGNADAPGTDSSPADTGNVEITLEGTWLSEGDNVAPLLVQLTHAVSISAVFGPQAFTVDTVDDQGQMVQQVGVYTAEPSGVGNIFNITLEQTMPQALTVEGIFEIDDSVSPAILTYEVVQTEPDVGAVPPTAAGGFGSTSFGSDLTQIFVRQ